MDSALEMMLEKYGPRNEEERENAIKEILQEIRWQDFPEGDSLRKQLFTAKHVSGYSTDSTVSVKIWISR